MVKRGGGEWWQVVIEREKLCGASLIHPGQNGESEGFVGNGTERVNETRIIIMIL